MSLKTPLEIRKTIRMDSRIESQTGLEPLFEKVSNVLLTDALEGGSLSDPRQRAMILVGVLVISTGAAFLVTLSLFGLYFFTGVSLHLTAAIGAALTVFGYIATLFHFKHNQRLLPAAHLYAITTTFSTILPCLITGGVTVSPYLFMVLVVPIFLFLIAGRRYGIFWSLATAVCVVILLAVESAGVTFPQIIAPQWMPLFQFSTWMMTLTLLVLGLFGYDRNFETLTRRIVQERGQFAYEAMHDGLTGLANRKLFFVRAKEAIEHAQQHQHKAAFIYIDLDSFKAINDESGHDVGDEVLKVVATRLKKSVRAKDTVARLGGDEFAIALHELESVAVAELLAEKLRCVIQEPVTIAGRHFEATGSLGVAVAPDQGTDVDELLRKADTAMYRAKEIGNKVRYATS
jgi:diguanylate cyclase (GGDEF)-like protein